FDGAAAETSFRALGFFADADPKGFEGRHGAMEVGGSRGGRALTVRREFPGRERGGQENLRLPSRGRRTRLYTGRGGESQRDASWPLRTRGSFGRGQKQASSRSSAP